MLELAAPMAGWAGPLDEVPDPVFAGRLMGNGLAIDPVEGILAAPCAGTVLSVHPARHAVTIRADGGVELLMHIGLDTVMLGGEGFTVMVAEGDRVVAGDTLVRFDMALLGHRARSLVTPVVVVNSDAFRIVWTQPPSMVAIGDRLLTVEAIANVTDARVAAGKAVTRTVMVPLVHGIHARPAARLAAAARGYRGTIMVAARGREARLVSLTGMLGLAIRRGDSILLSGIGDDAAEAVAAIAALIEGGMGEGAAVPETVPPVLAPVRCPPVDRMASPPGTMAGVTAAPGLAMGRAHRLRMAEITVDPVGRGAAFEAQAFAAACTILRGELTAVSAGSDAQSGIAAAHAGFLDDPALIGATDALIADGAGAGHAWRTVIGREAATLRTAADPRIAERAADLRDLERRLLLILSGRAEVPVMPPDGAILLAEDLLPSQLSRLSKVAGIATMYGGPTSHVAIIAAGMGLPTLVAVGDVLDGIADDSLLVLDADAGTLECDPAPARVAAVEAAVAGHEAVLAAARASAVQEGRTADGVRIAVMANLGSVADAVLAVAEGAEGCGLLRTEFLFLNRADQPGEDEQAREYGMIANALEGRPLTVRLLDIGGDKPAPYLPIAAEENPALGLRGIRVGLAHRSLLQAQIHAILRAGMPGQCRIMVPMVAGLDELRAVRAEVMAAQVASGRDIPIAVGVMVETPAAAMMADMLAREADFLSIGTNDLAQYTLAMDRGNAAVARGIDGLDPAVLRLIRRTCEAAAGAGRRAGACGGLASDLLAVPILLGLGVTELSVTPVLVGRVKALVRATGLSRARVLADAATACATAADVRRIARRFAEEADA